MARYSGITGALFFILMPDQKAGRGRRTERGDAIDYGKRRAASLVIGNVKNVVGFKCYVGGFTLHDFFERNWNLLLRSFFVAAINVSFLGGERHQSFGER